MFKIKSLNVEKSFESLLENEFLSDLEAAATLMYIPAQQRTSNQNLVLDMLKRKYDSEGTCPSNLFAYAPKHLRDEYSRIHSRILALLHSESYQAVRLSKA